MEHNAEFAGEFVDFDFVLISHIGMERNKIICFNYSMSATVSISHIGMERRKSSDSSS